MRFDPQSGECNEFGSVVKSIRPKPPGIIEKLMTEIQLLAAKHPEGIIDEELLDILWNLEYRIIPAKCTRVVNKLAANGIIKKEEWETYPRIKRYRIFPF